MQKTDRIALIRTSRQSTAPAANVDDIVGIFQSFYVRLQP
jgi:hypothetical protein